MKKSILFLFIPSLIFASVCYENRFGSSMSCDHERLVFRGLYGDREILYATPNTVRPKDGYPLAIFFQGSFFPSSFKRNKIDPFGGYNEILLMKKLLDNGYMIIAPKAIVGTYWQSNIIGINYDKSADKFLVNKIFNKIEDGIFGKVDMDNLFAFGISSGGYMTDRMFQSHKHINFNAFAIASASYAKCGGPYCPLPKIVDSSHPPTLFMHGKKDRVVPLRTMKKYSELLKQNHIQTKIIIDENATHQWIKEAPKSVLEWFNLHLK